MTREDADALKGLELCIDMEQARENKEGPGGKLLLLL
jgi:ribosomal 30S subunit maturation factor RimM